MLVYLLVWKISIMWHKRGYTRISCLYSLTRVPWQTLLCLSTIECEKTYRRKIGYKLCDGDQKVLQPFYNLRYPWRERERIRKRGKRKYFLVKSISALFTTERFLFRNFNKRWVVVAGNKIHMKDKSTSPISSDQFQISFISSILVEILT